MTASVTFCERPSPEKSSLKFDSPLRGDARARFRFETFERRAGVEPQSAMWMTHASLRQLGTGKSRNVSTTGAATGRVQMTASRRSDPGTSLPGRTVRLNKPPSRECASAADHSAKALSVNGFALVSLNWKASGERSFTQALTICESLSASVTVPAPFLPIAPSKLPQVTNCS